MDWCQNWHIFWNDVKIAIEDMSDIIEALEEKE
jgi:hypothetical protein